MVKDFGSRDDPRVQEALDAVVSSVNDRHSRFEQIKRYTILPRDFSPEEGEVTPTLKVKRKTVLEHFAGDVEQLYAD